MSKSLSELMQQIATLQKEADDLKREQLAGVIASIRQAIEHYDLTEDELFDSTRPKFSFQRRAMPVASPRHPPVHAPKYRDEHGNTWDGQAPRPDWIEKAVEAGRCVDEYLIRH